MEPVDCNRAIECFDKYSIGSRKVFEKNNSLVLDMEPWEVTLHVDKKNKEVYSFNITASKKDHAGVELANISNTSEGRFFNMHDINFQIEGIHIKGSFFIGKSRTTDKLKH